MGTSPEGGGFPDLRDAGRSDVPFLAHAGIDEAYYKAVDIGKEVKGRKKKKGKILTSDGDDAED